MNNRIVTKTKQGYKLKSMNVHIRKRRGTDNWEIAIYMPEKKRYKIESAHTNDLDEAIMLAHSKAAEVKFAEAHGIDLFPHKVSEVMPDFNLYIDNRGAGGTETKPMAGLYKKIAKNHILNYFGDMSLSKITQNTVNNYFMNMSSRTI